MTSFAASTTSLTPSSSEIDIFYHNLSKVGEKPVILSLVPGFCDAYVPLQSQANFPTSLMNLYDKDYLGLSYPDLLTKCEQTFHTLTLTSDAVKAVEEATKEQTKSKMSFSQRAGRITASKFKAAARTDLSQPSQSLIRYICYPESLHFKSKATEWGCVHERDALTAYQHQEEPNHSGFKMLSSGLVLSTEYPHMGSSPDSIVKCDCCGKRVVEVKCPFSCKNKAFLAATSEPTFFLHETNGSFTLKREHAYYYQIQLQMKICGTKFGDFVVW